MITGIKIKQIDNRLAKALVGASPIAETIATGLERQFSKENAQHAGHLCVVLGNKISMTRTAYERNRHWLGKLINRLSFVNDPNFIEINGIELKAVLELIEEETEIQIVPTITYQVPFSEAERILMSLKAIANQDIQPPQ